MKYRDLTMNIDLIHEGYHYRTTGFPSEMGSYLHIPAVRRNNAMPSGWEMADIMVSSYVADQHVETPHDAH